MMEIYPCARYHAHLAELHGQQSVDGPDIAQDSSYCAYACNLDPVTLEVPDCDAQFWSCPCAVARAMRDAKQHKAALWETAQSHSVQLLRVRTLLELANLEAVPKGH